MMLRHQVYSGGLTRDEHPDEYERAVREVAASVIADVHQHHLYDTAAELAGFGSWRRLQGILADLEGEDPVKHQHLLGVAETGLAAADEIAKTARGAWESDLVEIWFRADEQHRTEDWLQGRFLPSEARHRFTTSCSVGDRSFRLHYNSALYPQVEGLLEELETRVAEYKQD